MNYIGRTSSLHFLIGNELHRNGKVHGGSMNHIGTTLSLHFLIRSKLHCNGQVHGGSMNHIDPTSSLHFLIRNKLHRNGEVHRGSMNHYFLFLLLFLNSLQAWGSNLLTAAVNHGMAQFWPSARR